MGLVKHSSVRGADPSLCALGTGYSGLFNGLPALYEAEANSAKAFLVEVCYNPAMETDQIKKILSELLKLAEDAIPNLV
jgi:hypothetical protein